MWYTEIMNTFQKMLVAYQNGIENPYAAYRAAQDAGIPFAVMCAFLEKESAGGKNIFGHDREADGTPRPFYGAGKVTKKKYLAYKKERDAFLPRRRMQGVGPMQLTWWEFQDRADWLGGSWKPYVNMLVGAEIISDYWDHERDWAKVGERYNGRASYGEDLVTKIEKWRGLLNR